MDSEEQWKSIPEYPGYEVSDHGRVRSYYCRALGGFCQTPQRILRPGVNRGYEYVKVASGKRKRIPVSHLVLVAFIGPRPPNAEACHADGNRANNRLENLRWGTHRDNLNDVHLKHRGISREELVRELRNRAANGESRKSLAEQFGLSVAYVNGIVSGNLYAELPGP